MARYLLTGAAGFIGARVAGMLLDEGALVVGVDDLNDAYDVHLKERRLAGIRGRTGFEFIRSDIRSRAAVSDIFDRTPFDAVIHLAARAGVRPSVEDPWIYFETNVTGTLNLLDAAAAHDVEKFVFASSSSVYGPDAPAPCPETAPVDNPLSPYAASKVAGEALCRTYHALHGLDISMLRYFTVYGPAGRPDMAPFRFVQWIMEQRTVHLYGDGTQRRDFTYVDDIASGTIAALKRVGCEAFNLGCDTPVVLMDALHWIEEFAGHEAKIERQPRHTADVPSTWADVSKAHDLLGWKAQVSAREGLRRVVEWYRTNRDWASRVETG